ncbi:phage portal protein [Methylobacterium sp. CCH5-D2]|uniref:phage portal protein n=1 Tax=Methylobacterium sp. CCH5-D2 TaxID=1768765 RepID=UPI000831368B|nr:phage portal protein [Methylobacterium sp. CCH5-D2]
MLARLASLFPAGFARALGLTALQTRSYDGAAGGRRLRGVGEMPLPLAAGLAARVPLARRARYLAANNGHARAGTDAWVSALIGSGITTQSVHPDPATRSTLNLAFDAWTEEADSDGLLDWHGLCALAAHRLVVDGECFALMLHDSIGRLRLRMLDPEQINGAYHVDLPGGSRIVAGIEFDASGRRAAYHLFRERPGLPLGQSLEMIRVPAEDVIHLFRPETPGQVRGVSWFAPILLRLADFDAASDAQLMRQKISALLTGFIVDPTGEAGGFEGEKDGDGALDGGLEPGTLKVLRPGQDIRFSDPAAIGAEAIAYLTVTLREIAAGLGVPYSALTGDISDANFSSMRDDRLKFQRRAEALQHQLVVFQLCRPVWRRFVLAEILSGRIGAPDFEANAAAYLGSRSIPPRSDWVDPKADVEAEIAAIGAGLMSRRQAVAARGYDVEELDREIAEDRKASAALGLDFAARPALPQPQPGAAA